MLRSFAQVDVFTSAPEESDAVTGNPVAVVLDSTDLSDESMAQFARWTNLSETTFVLPPTDPAADYRLRIFTPGGELPFAGHPTLGSAHAWLASGGKPQGDRIVQECGIGLVELRVDGERLAFKAPELLRSGDVDDATIDRALEAIGVTRDDYVSSNWVDNGPGWMGIELSSARAVLDLTPDFAKVADMKIGVFGRYPNAAPADIEVRGFIPAVGVSEDPVTGSLNAGLAVWLRSIESVPEHYVASQGTVLGRSGRVYVDDEGAAGIWVGGTSRTIIDGTVRL